MRWRGVGNREVPHALRKKGASREETWFPPANASRRRAFTLYGTHVGALDGWRFCPRCASPITPGESRVLCDECGFVHYANSVPAVSALVVDGDRRVLLARRAYEPDAGLWDTPGGFLEEGEDPAAGLRRELLEETGLTVEIGDFVGMFTDRYGDGPGSHGGSQPRVGSDDRERGTSRGRRRVRASLVRAGRASRGERARVSLARSALRAWASGASPAT